ncbi:MAG: nitroreductase family protein [Chloroflexota bacterium]
MSDAADRIAFLRGLRATRRFTADPVPDSALRDILEIARLSGSAMNLQPWRLIVVRDRETLRALANMNSHAGHLASAPLAIFLVMDGDEDLDEAYDDGRLSERIMLAAAAHGLGSCIGWFVEPGHSEAAKSMLGVPEERTLRTAISIGYPAPDSAPRRPAAGRKPLAGIAALERFDGPAPF